MNQSNTHTNHMHFKSAQISAAELSSHDLAMINAYALAPLSAEDVFAFKVSMAGNDIDRDHEVFPYQTLAKFAHLFVGKTVIKDHQHVSDNQIARIYATNLVEGEPMRMTKTGEVYTELIAKCYMVKTSKNADLIAEIQAGIRKEVSLGCRIGKAVCSVCGKDNVKRYCSHFPGKEYKGETCYFSLEDPTDAYELSFVAIPAQQNAGTVKAYGEKPCYQTEVKDDTAETTAKQADELTKRLTVNQVDQMDDAQKRLTVNQIEDDPQRNEAPIGEQLNDGGEVTLKALDDFEQKLTTMKESLDALDKTLERINATIQEIDSIGSGTIPEESKEEASSEEDGQESVPEDEHGEESEKRLTVNQVDDEPAAADSESSDEPDEPDHAPEQANDEADDQGKRLTVNQVQEGSEPSSAKLNSDQDSSGSTPAAASTTLADEEETKEELKEKQVHARLRALELGLSLRNRA